MTENRTTLDRLDRVLDVVRTEVPRLRGLAFLAMVFVVGAVGIVMGGLITFGMAAGLAIGAGKIMWNRRSRDVPSMRTAGPVPVYDAPQRWSTDVINMANIKVAGFGGLGLVAMAAAVAFSVPSIGQSVMLGLFLGGFFAVFLVMWRRHQNPRLAGPHTPGAHDTLLG